MGLASTHAPVASSLMTCTSGGLGVARTVPGGSVGAYCAGQHEGKRPQQRQHVSTFCTSDSPPPGISRRPVLGSFLPPPQVRFQHVPSQAQPTKEHPHTLSHARHGKGNPQQTYSLGSALATRLDDDGRSGLSSSAVAAAGPITVASCSGAARTAA